MEKNFSIETWRGVAIILVVVGHVIGCNYNDGMRIEDPTSTWRYIQILIYYIHMPLFTAIAGWVYAYKPIANKGYVVFMTSKFKRLIVPMIIVSTVYYLLQNMTPGTNSKEPLGQIWEIYCFPYTFYWYLQSLFVIFIIVAALDKAFGEMTLRRWAWMLLCSLVVFAVQVNFIAYKLPNFFGFQGALEQLPYFVAGMGVLKFGRELYGKFKIALYLLSGLGVCLFCYHSFVNEIGFILYRSLLPLGIVPLLIIMLNMKLNSRLFVYFGTYAYSIYLFHGFGTSGGRIILNSLGFHSQLSVFLLSLALGVFMPIVVDKILSRNRYTGFLFFGKRL